jgi:hypothetical protein
MAEIVIDGLLIDGLERDGLHDVANRVRQSVIGLVASQGFAEYFNPMTGEGCGGRDFSWTAATYPHLEHFPTKWLPCSSK